MPKPYFPNNIQIPSIIRVNHAGEYGAKVIYQGQIDFTKSPQVKQSIIKMQAQELEHLEFFEQQIAKSKKQQQSINPSIFLPLWKRLGYYAGAISALIGTKASMDLTEAVENVIIKHYEQQISTLTQLGPKYNTLKDKITQFQADESEHINIATSYQGNLFTPSHLIQRCTKLMCHLAILLSRRW